MRVRVLRVILDNFEMNAYNFWLNIYQAKKGTFERLLNRFQEYIKKYFELFATIVSFQTSFMWTNVSLDLYSTTSYDDANLWHYFKNYNNKRALVFSRERFISGTNFQCETCFIVKCLIFQRKEQKTNNYCR